MIDMSATQTQLVTPAPARVANSRTFRFRDIQAAGRRYEELLAKLQRFRGAVYPPRSLICCIFFNGRTTARATGRDGAGEGRSVSPRIHSVAGLIGRCKR